MGLFPISNQVRHTHYRASIPSFQLERVVKEAWIAIIGFNAEAGGKGTHFSGGQKPMVARSPNYSSLSDLCPTERIAIAFAEPKGALDR